MALLLLDLGTVRQEGPEVTGLLLPVSLRHNIEQLALDYLFMYITTTF